MPNRTTPSTRKWTSGSRSNLPMCRVTTLTSLFYGRGMANAHPRPGYLRDCRGAQGAYQIGLVYARSCVEVGAPSGIGIPNRNASYVDHLGVGISTTRA